MLSFLLLLFLAVGAGVHRVGLHFDVLLDLVLLLSLDFLLEVGVAVEFVAEELAVGESGELLAEFDVLRVAVLVALAFKALVLGLGELGVGVGVLEH